MAIRLYKAYTTGTRNRTVSTFKDITSLRDYSAYLKFYDQFLLDRKYGKNWC